MRFVLPVLCLVATQLHAQEQVCPVHDNFHLMFGGDIESAVIYNGMKESGGGELSIGDFYVNLNLKAAYMFSKTSSIGFYFDWVPEQSVLNTADPNNTQNSNNNNWLRGDAYVSRPYLLPGIEGKWGVGESGHFRFQFGGFLASGLQPLDAIPSAYYLAMPLPLLQSQHYDKGLRLDYTWENQGNTILGLSASVIDGDWAVGESDVFALHNHANNSYPSVAFGWDLHPLAYFHEVQNVIGDVYAGTTATIGDLGSYPGEKRRQNNVVSYVGYKRKVGPGNIELRGFITDMERNPAGDGSGSHVDPVRTKGMGAELAYRDSKVLNQSIDYYASVWKMYNRDNQADGEIWLPNADATELKGWSAGIRWNDPLNITRNKTLYVGLQFVRIESDGEIPSVLNKNNDIIVVDMGLRF